jgi:predicted amidohydrolase YtcJ
MRGLIESRLLFVLSLAMIAMSCATYIPAPADLVLHNAAVYTLDEDQPWASAVAIRGTDIVYVGDYDGAQIYSGSNTRHIDLNEHMLLPGFHDTHAHPEPGGLGLTIHCNLAGLQALDPIVKKLTECASKLEEGTWLQGAGWSTGSFPNGNPHKDWLNDIPGKHPIFLADEGGHSAWVNDMAMKMAGIDDNTVDPHAGLIMRDHSGEASGTLRELAMLLVSDIMPLPSTEQRLEALRVAMRHANEFGITSMVDAYVFPDMDSLYVTLLDNDELTLRFNLAYYLGPAWDEDWAALNARFMASNELLRGTQIKLWMDGVMESQTAAVKQHYVGQPDNVGILAHSDQWMNRIVPKLEANGFQLHMHTIGDAAVSQALTALEKSREISGSGNIRPYLIHNYLISADDYPRITAADATVNFTMLWDQMDPVMIEVTKPFVTAEQFENLMPMGQAHDAGLVVTGGSDWPVTQISPLASIEVAVTGNSAPYHLGMPTVEGQATMVGERVGLDTMIRAYTLNAAYASLQEDIIGSIAVGKRADLVVLEKNLFEIPPSQISEVAVSMTLLNGRIVYEREPLN